MDVNELIKQGVIYHDLKILPRYFKLVSSGVKRFEIRKDDRNYKAGDLFVLREWDGKSYTGRTFVQSISYVLRDVPEYGLEEGYCIFCW